MKKFLLDSLLPAALLCYFLAACSAHYEIVRLDTASTTGQLLFGLRIGTDLATGEPLPPLAPAEPEPTPTEEGSD